ncbi:MAG: HAMP domain-containing histidine kinase [Bacteroidales bacterium]|jgi:signal transduction histidine kinase|nr:HAMP domain-containing histidine kinase [Bacteroidales bacterium]
MQQKIRIAVILTGVALICIIAAQSIWLYQSSKLHYALFDRYANMMLEASVEEEFDMRMHKDFAHFVVLPTGEDMDKPMLDSISVEHGVQPKDSIIDIGYDSESEFINIQNRLKYAFNSVIPPDIYTIDSIYSSLVKKEYPNDEVFIELTNVAGDSVIQSTTCTSNEKRRHVTGLVPLDKFSVNAIRGVVTSPSYFVIFTKTTGTMALSVFFALLTVACTLYIIQVVFKQKKYTQSVTDYTHYTVHQMQTPIMLATLSLKKLHSNRNDAEVDPYLDISEKNLRKLSSLSDALLNIATQEHSSMKITREKFDIVESVKALAEERSFKQQNKQVKIIVDHQFRDMFIVADRLHLINAVSNLIDNAIKYSEVQVTINVVLEEVSEDIRISVVDNGIGIEKEHLNHIFDRFYRVVGQPGHTAVKGFGLGLSYVRAVCEAHGGSVRVFSEKGEGSRFVMEIPDVFDLF